MNFLGVDATGLKSGPTGVKEWKKDLINMEKKNAAGDKNAADSEFYFWTKHYIKNHSDNF